ncbi:MAG: hypothetical protein GX621_10705 [Pirellulaceae bacterium]|nr:hypothetical protein [Pirellulaceae bacterium]
MPRIAVAILVVVTIGGAIAINTARYPVVWEMVSPTTRSVAPTPSLPEAAPAPVARESQEMDLSEVAPPPIRRGIPSRGDLTVGLPDAAGSELGEFGLTESRDDEYRSSGLTSGVDSMRLVSDPSSQPLPDAVNLEPREATRQEPRRHEPRRHESSLTSEGSAGLDSTAQGGMGWTVDRLSPIVASSDNMRRQRAVPSPAAPIVFGAAAYSGAAVGLGPRHDVSSSSAAPENHYSEKWPARVSPILKYAAQPAAAKDESDDWRADRPLVPIVRSGEDSSLETSSARANDDSALSNASTSESGSSAIRRLPGVPKSDETTPWIMPPRSADSPIPIYPRTGK